ncbi:MAG: hypothetical protein EZS26_003524 [Candidatus Ordinivivax streblomastigis]|uniref:MobA/VirD2-like nuclease domain-containing protein n=1 Tax=Candidatus Ordinivivax streblomastigis TaxID=2540710 RepID=A0A5M8NTF5_9BACT|nr:MAG: hypothetical protein EZS26_003524 [Candidatus Ordinivivax streblomastigis]
MLAKISSGKSVFGVLSYNQIKVKENQAEVLYRRKMFDSPEGKFSIRDCMDSFYPYLAVNNKTEKVVFHASLNPDPKDKLSDEQLAEIAQAYMQKLGYGNQPYIVFKHSDIKREHLHIVSLWVDGNGKKINDSYEVARSMKVCKELEQEFNLVPLMKGKRESEAPTKKIDYKAGDIKHQVGNITKSIMNHFYFQSFGEYRTLLEQFNVTAAEIKGEHDGKPYNGILYFVTDERGNKVGRPLKSSLFGKEVGYEALQKHYEFSKAAVEKKKIRESLRPVIAQAMQKASSKEGFKRLMREKGIGVIFRENETGRIYGVIFIDYQNRTVLNGSRLGKEFSANMFNELFDNNSKHRNETKHRATDNQPRKAERIRQNESSELSPGSVFSLFDMEQSGDDYEAENFAKEMEYNAELRRRKAKLRKKGRKL